LPQNKISFTENKGQISDQFYKPRPDVLFSGTAGDLVFHLKQNGISYQMTRVDKWKTPDTGQSFQAFKMKNVKFPEELTVYRLDVDWINSNRNCKIEKGDATEGFNNYYLESCPNGALGVKSFKQIIYRQLYNGIDLKWYEKDGNLKYDYIVAPNSDYKQIKLKPNGAENVSVNSKGELIIKTPLGEIIEQAPLVFQNEKQLKAKWRIENNIASFDIENVNSSLPLMIDPLVRLWGTYYGGNSYEWIDHGSFDASGNSYYAGCTSSTNSNAIATIGAYQTSFGGGGTWGDALVAKFTPSGVRVWGTYYGGNNLDNANGCVVDGAGDVYFTGNASTPTSTVIASVGSHQPAYGGGVCDAMLVKLNSNGVRIWGTYYGGSGWDNGYSIACDNFNNIFIIGRTDTNLGTAIATPGSHQPIIGGGGSLDGFIAKFDSNGNRIWGTYYGGPAYDEAIGIAADALGNIYVGGLTASTSSMSTVGSHQINFGGMGFGMNGLSPGQGDAFAAKFDALGTRVWGTYYGGSVDEYFYEVTVDGNGDAYFSGASSSSVGTAISSSGAHQVIYGGGASDGILIKFSPTGTRIWGTFYGGPGDEDFLYCSADAANNCVYISGATSTTGGTSIATPCTYQDTYGGNTRDGFLAKFDLQGNRKWGTYYGGPGNEDWTSVDIDPGGFVYLAGEVSGPTSNVIVSANAHQLIYGGGQYDGFIAKFDGCLPPPNTTPPPNQIICQGDLTILTSTLGCGIVWLDAIGGSPIGTGSFIAVAPVNTTTFYIDDISCGLSNSPTPVSVTVNPTPTLSINASQTLICSGTNVNLNCSGAIDYTWMPQSSNSTSINFSPTSSTTQSLIGSNGTCTNDAQVNILVIQYPTITVNYDQAAQCYSAMVTLSATGATNYSWSPSDQLTTSTGSLVTSIPLFQNTYFTLTGANTSGTLNCPGQKTFSVTIIPAIDSKISDSTNICEGDNVGLAIFGGNTYHWLPATDISDVDQPTVTVNPVSSTIYSVAVSFNEFCPLTRTVYVNVFPKPKVYAGNDTTINIGEHVILEPTGEGAFRWLTGENMTCMECRNPEILPFTKTCYVVELTDMHHCKAQDEICVEIVNDYGVYIPNTFTPNGDDKNEFFKPEYYGMREIKLTIFDRWGNQLFYTEDQDARWDGYYLGKICKQDVYVYKLQYEPYRGNHGDRVGNVNLIR
jgi:gliding motility-associated-like protein